MQRGEGLGYPNDCSCALAVLNLSCLSAVYVIGRIAGAAASGGLIERALSPLQAVTYLSRRLVRGYRRCSGGRTN